jgi:hypothetical protein
VPSQWRGSDDQRPTVEGPPFQPQPPRFDEIDNSDLVALPETAPHFSRASDFQLVQASMLHQDLGHFPGRKTPQASVAGKSKPHSFMMDF